MVDSAAEQIKVWNENVAARYDGPGGKMFEREVVDQAVDFLADLAGDGPSLEFAIGTGRVAVPLSERGVKVSGIDVSQPMIGVLRQKASADTIPVTVGSMATADAPGSDYQLIYIVYNAITCLLYQDEQIACFQNAVRHLRPGGYFVIEVWVPQLRRLAVGQTVAPGNVSDAHVGFDTYDLVSQRLTSHHCWMKDGEVISYGSTPHRYVWPSEMDVMAKMAGLQLSERVADWDRSEFTDASESSVSVWRKPSTDLAD